MLDILVAANGNKAPSEDEIRVSNVADKPIKSFLKSVSWRIVGTIDTMVISYFITGKVSLAVSIGSVEVITKTILYYFHERLWAHIHRIRVKHIFKHKEVKYANKRVTRTARRVVY